MQMVSRLNLGLGLSMGVLLTTACQNLYVNGGGMVTTDKMATLGTSQTLVIAPERVACHSKKPMQCMLASPYSPAADSADVFEIAYNAIEGFSPQQGVRYVIKAQPIENASTDSVVQWVLQRIEQQDRVQ